MYLFKIMYNVYMYVPTYIPNTYGPDHLLSIMNIMPTNQIGLKLCLTQKLSSLVPICVEFVRATRIFFSTNAKFHCKLKVFGDFLFYFCQ